MDIDDDNLWRINLFDVLGIQEETDKDEMKSVYKQLAKKFHPDRFPAGSPAQNEAKEKFSGINRAYEILSHEGKRAQYLDTRRLLADHLAVLDMVNPVDVPPAAKTAAPTPTAASSAPPPPKPAASHAGKGGDYKLKEAEDAFKEGNTLFNKSELDGAISAFQSAIALMPDTAKYHSNLGRAFLMKGWKGSAQSAFKQALVLNPNDPVAKKHYEPEKAKKKGLLDGLLGRFKKGN